MNESDPRSNVHYLGSSENKAWKKFKPVWDSFTSLSAVQIYDFQNRLQLPACFTKNVVGMFFHLCYLSASFFQFLIEV